MLVTLGVGAAAVNTGNNLLYLVLGMMLSLIVLSGILSEVVLRGLRVRRALPKRAFAGAPCLIELAVENRKQRAPSYSVELEDVAAAEPNDRRCFFLKIPARTEQTATYRRIPAKRGRLQLSALRVRTRYPFGLFEKSREVELEDELIVYPALALHDGALPDGGWRGAERTSRQRGVGSEIDGVREYREGDEARSIHWRRTASLGRLVVRDRRRDATPRVVLVIDEARVDGVDPAAWDEAFEQALSRAATSAQSALQSGAAVEAVARTGASPVLLPGQSPDAIWRFLALLQAVDARDAPPLPTIKAGEVRRFGAQLPARGAA